MGTCSVSGSPFLSCVSQALIGRAFLYSSPQPGNASAIDDMPDSLIQPIPCRCKASAEGVSLRKLAATYSAGPAAR